MQKIIPSAKRLISMCLVTLLLVTSTLLSLPAPAKADTDVVMYKCASDCSSMSNTASFAVGAIAGSAVTLMATGNAGVVTAAISTLTAGLSSVAVPFAAASPAMVAAAPVLAPVAAVGALGYSAYRLWEGVQNSQAQASK